MKQELTPTESDLWQFALVCTNDQSGAARVLSSLVRDHGDLAKVSEARLRQAVLRRAEIWQGRANEERSTQHPLSTILSGLRIEQRGMLWMDAVLGCSAMELAWVLRRDPAAVRSDLKTLGEAIGGESQSVIDSIRADLENAQTDELLTRLGEARTTAFRRDRRRGVIAMASTLIFIAIMLFVLRDLLSWQDASETLPNQNQPAAQQGDAP